MHVAKHWRNQKQRYRLIRKLERSGIGGSHSQSTRLGGKSRDHQPGSARVKVLS